MRSLLVIVAFAAAGALGCPQDSSSSGGSSQAYRADIENICNAEERSGALAPGEDPNRRAIVVAQWIAGRIQSEEGRRFLVSLQKLEPAEKGAALRNEAARAGLAGCALAEVWK